MSTPVWRKSSRSAEGTSGQCVEVAALPGAVGVRDSKDPDAGHLELTPNAFRELLRKAVDRWT
ncbi:DUF397 domain-containing protein [Actinomadura sp. KC216]|uniref:DUF397 domain-containing protein n=1 Tax=Actinomadura sp. KC216 TaxID=2530370 RepID=UPI00104CEB65|nr:DUF397 domain-containing protein [Actinomadura sp. KC216]TDB84052.1 DUF397 domain-containing protein [Actinomadura sp. KC216]